MTPLSSRQQQVLGFVREHVRDEGFPPTLSEITEGVGLTRISTVNYHLNALMRMRCLASLLLVHNQGCQHRPARDQACDEYRCCHRRLPFSFPNPLAFYRRLFLSKDTLRRFLSEPETVVQLAVEAAKGGDCRRVARCRRGPAFGARH